MSGLVDQDNRPILLTRYALLPLHGSAGRIRPFLRGLCQMSQSSLVENSLPPGPWVRTPRWALWRKKHRRVQWYLWRDMHRPYWRYANDREVALAFLENSFAPK